MRSICLAASLLVATALLQEGKDAVVADVDRLVVQWQRAQGALPSHAARIQSLQARAGLPLKVVEQGADHTVVKLAQHRSPSDLAALASKLVRDPYVSNVDVDVLMQPTMLPDDPEFIDQWNYQLAPGHNGANLPSAWDITTGADVVVAVVDTGILPHADLVKKTLPGYDMVSDPAISNDGDGRDADATDPGDYTSSTSHSTWHGTHCAGIIGATSNNSVGIAGVSWGARLLPVRVLGAGGGYMSDIADGILWAAGLEVPGAPLNTNPAKVISLSLGAQSVYCYPYVQDAIDRAVEVGATVVVAAGNWNRDASTFCPANCNNVVVVGAHTVAGARASYSNFGPRITLMAPGGDVDGVLSTLNTGTQAPGVDTYAEYRGTSMAVPHVSGVIALLLSVSSSLSPQEVERILRGTARPFPTAGCDELTCGAGLLDAALAVSAASLGTIPSRSSTPSISPSLSPSPSPEPSGSEISSPTASPSPSSSAIRADAFHLPPGSPSRRSFSHSPKSALPSPTRSPSRRSLRPSNSRSPTPGRSPSRPRLSLSRSRSPAVLSLTTALAVTAVPTTHRLTLAAAPTGGHPQRRSMVLGTFAALVILSLATAALAARHAPQHGGTVTHVIHAAPPAPCLMSVQTQPGTVLSEGPVEATHAFPERHVFAHLSDSTVTPFVALRGE